MLDKETVRYDFGGSEEPWDDTITIVDIQNYPEYRKETNNFIHGDLTEILCLPEKAKFINLSKVLRYIIDPAAKFESFESIIKNIDLNLNNGGIIRLFDYESYVLPIVDILMNPSSEFGGSYENFFNITSEYKII